MARKADVKGGNGDVVFDTETGTARKYLRNTSTVEKVARFKRELAVFQELCKNPIPNVVEVTDVYINEDKIAESYVEMKKYDGSVYDILEVTKGNVKLAFELLLPVIKALYTLSTGNPPLYHRDIKPDNILFLKKGDNADNGKYYLEVTGVEAGTCHLEVYDRDDAGLYDIVTIYVISSDDGAVGTEAETEADTVPPVGAKRTLEVPAIKDNTVTVDGIFVGETQIITEEDTIMFTGNLSSDGAEDVYSYTAPRDGRYGFKVLNINATESVRLTVFDSSGNSLLDTWNGVGYVAMSSGKTYKIRVRQYSGYPKYTLNLYVQKPTVDISATTTVYDQVTFEDQKNDYTFTAPVTGRYHFELSEYKSGVGFRMMMWDKFANNFMDSWTESATVDLDAGETYNFQIRQEEGFGSYVLSVGFQKETIDITGVTAVYDSIEYTDQKNVYTFTAPVTGRYHFELSEYKNGVGFRMMMWDKLEYNIMDSWNGSATVDLDAGEAYSLQIRQDKSAYSYKLSIGSQKKYVDITGYDIVTDAITFKDQKNVYFFTPSEAGEYTFSLTDYNANCSFKLMAWDDYEKNIMDTYSGKGTLSLEGGITYEIQVRQNENLGSYELHVEKEK